MMCFGGKVVKKVEESRRKRGILRGDWALGEGAEEKLEEGNNSRTRISGND